MQIDKPEPIGIPQVLYRLRYSDGVSMYKTFPTEKEAEWYIHNEGDHLLEATLVD